MSDSKRLSWKHLSALAPPAPSRPEIADDPGPISTPAQNNPRPKFDPGPKDTPVPIAPGSPGPTAPSVQKQPRPKNSPGPKTTPGGDDESGYTPAWPHSFWDRVGPTLDPVDTVVLGHLFRLTAGWRRDTCKISHQRLAERVNVSRNTIRRSLARLAARGLVERIGDDVTSESNEDRGIIWRVPMAATWSKTPPGPKTTPGGKSGPGPKSNHMKSHENKYEKAPVADAPDGLIYQIRQKAVRLREILNRGGELTHAMLREHVRIALDADGVQATDEEIEEAIVVMLPPK